MANMFHARALRVRHENKVKMANKTQKEELRSHEEERDFFCVVRDAFRIFARRSAIMLGSAWAFVGAVLVILVWLLTGPTFHFSDTWQLIINTGTTIITFLMVFVIQNTQSRDMQSIQLKLDELIRVNETARNSLIDLEEMSDGDLERIKRAFATLASIEKRTSPSTRVSDRASSK